MEFKVIESGDYGGISMASEKIVNNHDDFNSLFSELHKYIYPSMPPYYSPEKSYIFITFGKRSSGGLNFKVKEVRYINNKLTVTLESIHKTTPNRPLITTQAIANPYMVIEIDKISAEQISLIKE